MRSGVFRDRMSRLRPFLAVAALSLTGVAALALLLSGAPTSVAHAAALDSPTPTYNPLIVPTAAAPSGSGLGSSALSTSSAGIEVAFALSCVTTIAGLIIAALTLTALLRTGYGPFLRTLAPKFLRGRLPAQTQEPTLRYRPSRANGPQTGFDLYAEAPRPRHASRTARRDDWQDWDAPARRPHASQARRGDSRSSRSRY
jgi:hypothetical protein